jgi:hypothetical protein
MTPIQDLSEPRREKEVNCYRSAAGASLFGAAAFIVAEE